MQAFASLGKDVIVHNNQIAVLELLGEGTFAKVFKATLKQEKPPAPVSVSFNIAIVAILAVLDSKNGIKLNLAVLDKTIRFNFINH